MELHDYQKKMWLCVKKYLKLKSLKKGDHETDKVWDSQINSTIKEIININEKQKTCLSFLRNQSESVDDENKDLEMSDNDPTHMENYTLNLFKTDVYSPSCNEMEDLCSSSPDLPPSPILLNDIHDLVTPEEYMHSLGLLTRKESTDVLKTRRDRQKKSANWHVFSATVWEKQETKRKRRDWLVSGSPPQLRRKTARAPSRSTSPLEGSSSPTSSLSSPASPSYQQEPIAETCITCHRKGANLQCDGCGIHFHESCVDLSTEGGDSFPLRWLCSKCQQMGMRVTTYRDPIHYHKPVKGTQKRKSTVRH